MSKSNVALSNLRAVVIVIVVAFHAALAYLASVATPTARFDQAPYLWQAFPIVDGHRWLGFDIFCAWQDVSLMSLMFLLSGLLAAGSLRRRGGLSYFAARLWRIGVPFLLAVLFLSPLAFYPAYLVRAADGTLGGFWKQWLSLPSWPNGPEWFLWQLLALNTIAAALYVMAPGYIDRLSRVTAWAAASPLRFFAVLSSVSILAYVPLAMIYSPWTWGAVGAFSVQLCRPAHYLVYFFAGVGIGSLGLDRGLLAEDGMLARNWKAWFGAALLGFCAWAGLTALTRPHWWQAPLIAQFASAFAFPFACATGGLFLLAICLRFHRLRSTALDSLSANAYSIYLVHYIFVVWLQYALLDFGLPAIVKWAIVFSGGLVLSWGSAVGFWRLWALAQAAAAKRRPIWTAPN
ncbi:MAG TPA: acyltransferase [Pseudolabrys sp.]|nr:acyltransferase [Pseudolabrys sp.]